MRYAVIDNGIVENVIEAEEGFAIEGKTLVPAGNAGPGWGWDGRKFVEPEPIEIRRRIGKSVIISRLTDNQVAMAIGLLTPKQAERWRAPDQPTVFSDDPETLAIIKAVGADAETIMAPE